MRSVLAGLGSWLFPGFGAGLVGRMTAMVAWVVACVVVSAASLISIWLIWLALILRCAAAIDGFRVVRAAGRAGARVDGLGGLIAIGLNLAPLIPLRLFAAEAFKIPSSSMVPTLQIGDQFLADKLSLLWRPAGRGDVVVFRQPCEPSRDYVMRVVAVAGDTVEIRCNVVHVGGAPLASQLVQGDGCAYADFDDYTTQRWYMKPCSEYVETNGGHTYHVLHDAERPSRDARPSSEAKTDNKDFPRLDGARQPPSCSTLPDDLGAPGASKQAPGSLVETKPGAAPCELQLHYVVPPDHVFVLGDNRPNSNDSRYWGAVPVANIRGRAFGIWFSNGRSGPSLRRIGGID